MERAALKTLMSSYVTASELFDVEVIYFSGDVQPGFRGPDTFPAKVLPIMVSLRGRCLEVMTCSEGAID